MPRNSLSVDSFSPCDDCSIDRTTSGIVAVIDMGKAVRFLEPMASMFEERNELNDSMKEDLGRRFDLSDAEANKAWSCAQSRALGDCALVN